MATYNVNITISPLAKGTVKVGSNLASGTVQEEGVTVNLLGAPISGWGFVSYVIDGGAPITTASHSFVMPSADVNITATFFELPTPITTQQASIYDTSCPKFFFVDDLSERFFTGDVINLESFNYTEIVEPVGFDAGSFMIERDDKYHGFNYEFSTDSLKYEIGTVGYNYLKTKLTTEGTDSNVKFLYGFGLPEAFTIFYYGKVDFNEYAEEQDGSYVGFKVRELDFDNVLQTTFDIDQSTTPNLSLLLYSKVIPKEITYLSPKPNQVITTELDLYPKMFYPADSLAGMINIPYQDPIKYHIFVNDGREGDNIEGFVTYDFQVDTNDPATEGAGLKFLFRALEAGVYRIDVSVTFRMYLINPSAFLSDDPTYSWMKLIIFETADDGVTVSGAVTTLDRTEVLNDPVADGYIDLRFETTQTIDGNGVLEKCTYLYFQIDPLDLPSFFGTGAFIEYVYILPYEGDARQPSITVSAETLETSSKANTIKPLNLLESVFSQAAEANYPIVSSDFFDDGCGSKLTITNGFGVRGAELSDRTDIKVSPKKLVDSLLDLFCLGWGVEYDDVNRELVKIEGAEYFYQDVEILALDEVSEYSLEVDTSMYYNEIEIGFSKYSKSRETDKGNTLDDFHTKHTYNTPIKTNKNKLSVVSDLTLSGYEIEILRRKQFEESGNDDNANFREDEELFGVQAVDYTLFTGGTYTGFLTDLSVGDIIQLSTTRIIVLGYAYFYGGQQLDVNVDSQGNKRTSVLSIRYGYYVPTGFAFSVLGTFIQFTVPIDSDINPLSPTVVISNVGSEAYIVPESLQTITASNLVSPQTAYNLRYSPKRMLYNWAKLFNGGFFGKAVTDEIVFKQGDGNVELSTQFDVSETCRLGDLGRDTIVEDANVQIQNLYGGLFLYSPLKASFSTSLSFEQLTDLKKCLRGRDGVRDYGYITVNNYCGTAQKVYITSLEYSPVTEEAKITGYLKSI